MTLETINMQIKDLAPGERLRIEGVPDHIYHATTGVGSTNLKRFIESPAGFKYGDGFQQKDCFDLGSAVHTLVLEPHLFNDNYVSLPEGLNLRTKAGKEIKALFDAENEGKTVLKSADMEKAKEMSDSVLGTHSQWFEGGAAEVSYWYRHENGLVTKARIDYEIGDLAIDLKTTADASPAKFEKKAIDFGYHIQNQLYIKTTGLEDFVFVVVNNKKPFQVVGPMMFDDDAKKLGLLEVEKAVEELKHCIDEQEWPAYLGIVPNDLVNMGLAPWHLRRLDELQSDIDWD